jgi:hypothetical protein
MRKMFEPSTATIKQYFGGEPTRPLAPSERKMLQLQEKQLQDARTQLDRQRAAQKERQDKVRKAALRAAQRGVQEARVDRWEWLRSKLRLGEDVVAGIDRSKAPRGASPRRAELAPTSPGSPSQRKKKLRPHETQTVAFCSKVHGEGLRTALTRQATSFVIEAHDASGTRQHTGGDAFVVQIKGRSMVSSKVSDREDGSYVAVYRTPVSGAYLISVTLHGAHVAQSPYEVTVLEPRCNAHLAKHASAHHGASPFPTGTKSQSSSRGRMRPTACCAAMRSIGPWRAR